MRQDVATSKHLTIETPSRSCSRTRSPQLRVAMIYAKGEFVGLPEVHPSYLLGLTSYDANFTSHLDVQINIKQSSGVSQAAALAAVERAAGRTPESRFSTGRDSRSSRRDP